MSNPDEQTSRACIEIAVIGMAGRFPGADNIDKFWENLKNGVESISFLSLEELKELDVDSSFLENPNYVNAAGGIIDDKEYFDALFFDYTPIEAELSDPQVRIFLESSWEALENAGYDPGAHTGLIGLYAGADGHFNWEALALVSGNEAKPGTFATSILTEKDLLCTTTSYKLNLKGPSVLVQTACSTSLVAIHLACQAIINGECDMALAGGVSIRSAKKTGYIYQEGMIHSPDGHCRAFDARAKGSASGEGAGVVVLKLLEDALADKDHIYAVVKGSVINNDGTRKSGYTAPSREAQTEVIRAAQQVAEVVPESISYVETHGTGTLLGDPIEIDALTQAFNTRQKNFCAIGSVKCNIGHLGSAAGVAGFIKTVLALKHKLIPPSINFHIPSPQIDFIDSPFCVNSYLNKWKNDTYPLRAGVSSFGIGGTNAHVVLEEWPIAQGTERKEHNQETAVQDTGKRSSKGTGGLTPLPDVHPLRKQQLILLSAKTQTALEKMTQNLAEYFKNNLFNGGNHENTVNPASILADAAYTLQVGRKAFEYRKMFICRSAEEAVQILSNQHPDKVFTNVESDSQQAADTDGLPDNPTLLIQALHKDKARHHLLLNKIGRLWLQGVNIDWGKFWETSKRHRIPLPTYPFERQRYWIDGDISRMGAAMIEKNSQLTEKPDTTMADWFYFPTWKHAVPDPQKRKPASHQWRWLVFVNRLNPGKLLVQQLKENYPDVVTVEMGHEQKFERKQGNVYTINPRQSQHYETLFNQLAARKLSPDKIVHCWNVTGQETGRLDRESFDAAQYQGFFSLLYTAKAIGKQDFKHDIHITFLSNHTQAVIGKELLRPEKSTVLGLLKSIPQEYPGIRCTSTDIQLPEPGSGEERILINTLLQELTAGAGDTVIAYRNNKRWIQVFDSLHLEEPEEQYLGLRKRGVYLITGGLGAIGLMFSQLLVKHAGARLILTGRSDFPGKDQWGQWLAAHDESHPITLKIKKLQKIEEMGGQVIYIRADAADLVEMRNVVNRAEKTFGEINGVIHSAGFTEAQAIKTIQEVSPTECYASFAPKVYGLLVLEQLFKDKDLDFCWMVSSISCVLGGLGFGPYASANFFMDVFVKQHNQVEDSHWFSLNWDGMDDEKSISAFKRIMGLEKIDQLVFSGGGDLHGRIDRWIKLKTVKGTEPAETGAGQTNRLHPRPNLPTQYLAPRNLTEQTLTNIWQNLLGIDKIGIHDDFLALGGDSLKAITVISRIHQQLDVNIPVAEFFNRPFIEKLSQYIDGAEKQGYLSPEPSGKKEYYVLSSAQKRMYILQQVHPNITAYNLPTAVELHEVPDLEKFTGIFRQMIKRHETLRTSFVMLEGGPVQIIKDNVPFEMEIHESVDDKVEEKKVIVTFVRPFDLSQPPLIRVGMLNTSGGRHILMVDMHHITSDAVSFNILLKDFFELYAGNQLLPLRLQYKDFSEWQNNERGNDAVRKQEKYWLEVFAGEIPVLELPTDYKRPQEFDFKGNIVNFTVEKETWKLLDTVAKETETTLSIILSAAYYILLSKYSRQEDIVVGTSNLGRRNIDLQNIIGMFINMLPVRNQPRGDKTFKQFLGEVKENLLAALENQDYQFDELVGALGLERDPGRNPLFNVVFNMVNVDVEEVNENQLKVAPYVIKEESTVFDLIFSVHGTKNINLVSFKYSTQLFKKATIEKMSERYVDILNQVLDNIDIKLADIKLSHRLLATRSGKQKYEENAFEF